MEETVLEQEMPVSRYEEKVAARDLRGAVLRSEEMAPCGK